MDGGVAGNIDEVLVVLMVVVVVVGVVLGYWWWCSRGGSAGVSLCNGGSCNMSP